MIKYSLLIYLLYVTATYADSSEEYEKMDKECSNISMLNQDLIKEMGTYISISQTKIYKGNLEIMKGLEKLQNSIDELSSAFVAEKKNDVGEINKTMNLRTDEKSDEVLNIYEHKNGLSGNLSLGEICLDLYNDGRNVSGIYWIKKYNTKIVCDNEKDGGGWLVILKRRNITDQVDFQRDWLTYKEGFGDVNTEFWIGNDKLHVLTNQKNYELRIDMEDFENGTFYASYSDFRVMNEESGYELRVENHSGTASDALAYHHRQKFTTVDRDNDALGETNCAEKYSGGFWYKDCSKAHLTGVYSDDPNRDEATSISWSEDYRGRPLVLVNVEVKIRPKTT